MNVLNSVTTIGDYAFAGNQLTSTPMTAQQRLQQAGQQVEQARLAGVFQQAGPSTGNLNGTLWESSFGPLMDIVTFGIGIFTHRAAVGLEIPRIVATGTFRVSGNTVIFLSSSGVYTEGSITGYTLRVGNSNFSQIF